MLKQTGTDRNAKLEKANQSLSRSNQSNKPVSLSQVRHQMMKQTSVESTKSPPPPPAAPQPAAPAKKEELAKKTSNSNAPPKVMAKVVTCDKKENFASRTMKGFMKLIGKDEATVPPVSQPPAAPPSKPSAPPTQAKGNANEKSVLKMIQTRLKQQKPLEPDDKAEKSKEYMDQFRVQGQWAVSQNFRAILIRE